MMAITKLTIIVLVCSTVFAQKFLEPKWVYPQKIFREDLEPIGQEGSEEIFIARGHYDNNWIPGKLTGRFSDGAYIPYYGEKFTKNMQVLYIPPGTAKWVNPFVHGNSAAIYGGAEPEPVFSLFVCRAWIRGFLIPGKYSKSTLTCYIPYAGEHALQKDFELLVRYENQTTNCLFNCLFHCSKQCV